MCGILGVISSASKVEIKTFRNGLTLLKSRGPDSDGIKELRNGEVVLGHTRLSIIETTSAGNQPLSNEDETLWITFNGEIYNYLELREELIAHGHLFKTKTDTEVILHAYEEWGDSCISKLRGIFAFGIYSTISSSLFLARDNSGVKPLYYSDRGTSFAFASTPSSLLAAMGNQRELDDNSLMGYFWYGNVPGNLCIYKGVSKLPPGCTLFLKQGNLYIETPQRIQPEIRHLADQKELKSQLQYLLKDSVQYNQRSDVPIAYFLSGGLDSAIISSLAQENSISPIRTFSIGFDSPESDETLYALHASRTIGTDHSVAILTYEKAIHQIWDVASSFDEPFHINGLIPFTFLCKFVKEAGFKVSIGGDGADELFGGYHWHSTWWNETCNSRRGRLGKPLKKFRNRPNNLSKYLQIFLESSGGVAQNILQEIGTARAESFLLNQFDSKDFDSYDAIKYPLMIDQHCFLPDHCLPKVDRCSMHYGLEVRVPFLDQTLLSFVKELSGNELIPNCQRKYLLKKAFEKRLAGFELERKKGFSSPLGAWWDKGFCRIVNYAIDKSSLIQSSSLLTTIVRMAKENNDFMSLITLFSLALWSDYWLEDRKLADANLLLSL